MLLGATVCAGPAQRRYEEELARSSPTARHAVHDARLRELMVGLERLRSERLPTPLDPDEEAEARAARVADIALAMAESAGQIAGTGAGRELDAAPRRDFEARAAALEQSLRRLAEEARRRPPGDVAGALASVDATCNGCHASFRDGGPGDGH